MADARPQLTAFESIDMLRALAATAVVLSHARHLLIVNPTDAGLVHKLLSFALSLGEEAVMVFFVISGFWIIRSVVSAGAAFSWANYLTARLSRLWVVAIPAIIIGGLTDFAGLSLIGGAIYDGTQGVNSVTYDVGSRLTAQNLGGTLLFLQTIVVPPFGSNGPLWSLAYEFWYYIWFPALWLALVHRRFSLWLIVPIGMAILFPALNNLFLVWCLGGIVHWLVSQDIFGNNIRRLGVWPVLGAALLFLLAIVARHAVDLGTVGLFAVGATFGLLLWTLVSGAFRAPGFLRPVATFGAMGSYSLYVTHFPLLLLIAALFVPSQPMQPSFVAWGAVFLLTLVAIAYAQLFALLTERQTSTVRRLATSLLGLRPALSR